MTKPVFAAATLMLALAVPFVGTAHSDETTLQTTALEGLFPGHYEARVAGGYRLLIAAKEDGTMLGRAFGKEDKGKWVVKDEELCISWRSWTRGKYKCGTITQNGEWFVATNTKDGETMQFKPVDKREVYTAQIGRKAARD